MTFIEKNIARLTKIVNESIFATKTHEEKGLLQSLDPRTKILCFIILLFAVNLTQQIYFIIVLYLLFATLAFYSKIPLRYFILRAWLFVSFFTGIIALPTIFNIFTPGENIFTVLNIKTLHFLLYITDNGLKVAFLLLMRVATCISLSMLLVLTTDWIKLMKALDKFSVPKGIILMLLMTYRYIFVLVQAAENMFLARRSRMITAPNGHISRILTASLAGNLFDKTQLLSEEVIDTMRSRGFRNKIYILSDLRLRMNDYIAFSLTIIILIFLYFIFK